MRKKAYHWFSALHIGRKQWLIFICTAFVPLVLLCVLAYQTFYVTIQRNTLASAQGEIAQTSQNIETLLKQLESTALTLSTNEEVQNALARMNAGEAFTLSEKFTLEQQVISFLDYGTMKNIGLLSRNGNEIWVPYEIEGLGWQTPASGQRATWHGVPPEDSIQLLHQVVNPRDYTTTGWLLITVYGGTLRKQYQDLNFNQIGNVLVFDEQGQVVTAPEDLQPEIADTALHIQDGGEMQRLKIGRQSYYVFSATSPYTGWKTVGVITASALLRQVHRLGVFMVAAILVVLLLALVAANTFSQYFQKRFARVDGAMAQVAGGTLTARLPLDDDHDFGPLNQGFNQMTGQIQHLIHTVYEAKLLQKESDLMALQAQVNPHFLNNTLSTIHWQAQLAGQEEIAQTVMALASLLRASIENKSAFVPLSDELKYIEDYIFIQKKRFRDRITTGIEVDPAVHSWQVPRMILQPIVENAFVHGVEPLDTPGKIRISAGLEQNELVVSIEDNGAGIPGPLVAQILQGQAQEGRATIGVSNVHKRLQLLYGPEYGLVFTTPPGGGTAVSLRIPAKTAL